jgi:hypothetical protein
MEMRLYLKLDIAEYRALAAMAKAELRDDREQLRYLLREEAQRRGLLVDSSSSMPEEQNRSIEHRGG